MVRWRRAERAVRCGCRELGLSLPSLRAHRVRGQPAWSGGVPGQRRARASRNSSAGVSAAPGSVSWLAPAASRVGGLAPVSSPAADTARWRTCGRTGLQRPRPGRFVARLLRNRHRPARLSPAARRAAGKLRQGRGVAVCLVRAFMACPCLAQAPDSRW